MRKLVFLTLLTATLTGCAMTTMVQPPPELESVAPYPVAADGYERWVIWLKPETNEQDLKVELLPGMQMMTDCNIQRLSGMVREHSLEGWGYSFHELTEVKGPLSTMMACPDGTLTQTFVPVVGEGTWLRYNSKLPVVVYTPKDIKLRYRIWSAGPEQAVMISQ